MNKLHDRPIRFHELLSPDDTREACEKYNVKLPALNADLFAALLQKTTCRLPCETSLVRGWREGLDLDSDLPEVDDLVDCPNMVEVQLEVLRSTLKLEAHQRRFIRNGRWFTNTWVLPYFVIPKRTPPEQPQRWRLIHHQSFHVSGNRSSSVSGHVNIEEFPTVFPIHLTGAHLIF